MVKVGLESKQRELKSVLSGGFSVTAATVAAEFRQNWYNVGCKVDSTSGFG